MRPCSRNDVVQTNVKVNANANVIDDDEDDIPVSVIDSCGESRDEFEIDPDGQDECETCSQNDCMRRAH